MVKPPPANPAGKPRRKFGRRDGIRKAAISVTGAIAALGGGTAVSQAVTVISAPIISRLFTPEAYGLAALFASVPAIIVGIGCLCYDQAILIPKREREAANVFSLSLLILAGFSLLLTLVVLLGRRQFARLLGAPELEPYLWLWPVSFFLLGAAFPLKYWHTRQNRFRILAGIRIANTAGGKTIRIGGGLAGFRSGGNLIILNLVNSLIIPLLLTAQLLRSDARYILRRLSWRAMRELAARYRKFPLFLSWSGMVDQFSSKIPVILLGVYFGTGVVGLYSLAMALLQMPLEVVAAATSQVLFQRAAAARAAGKEVESLVVPIFRQLTILGLYPAGALLLTGPMIFSFFLGERWLGAGDFAAILAPWLLTILVGSPLSIIFVVFEKQSQFLAFNAALCAARVGALILGGVILADPEAAIAVFSAVSLVFSAAMIAYSFRAAGISWKKAARPLLPCSGYLVPFLAAIAAARWVLILPAPALLSVAFGLGLLYYFLLFRRVEVFRDQVTALLERLRNRRRPGAGGGETGAGQSPGREG